MQWFYADDNRGQHAIHADDLPHLIASGTIRAGTLVWNESMSDWLPAAQALPDHFPHTASPPLLTSAQRRELAPLTGPAFPGQRAPVDALAICSLVFGILSILACGPLLGLPAVICGHICRKRARAEVLPSSNGGLCLAGLITGYIGLAFTLLLIAFYATAIIAAIASEGGINGVEPTTP